MLTAQPCPRQIHPKSSLPYDLNVYFHRRRTILGMFVCLLAPASVGGDYQLVCAVNVTLGGDYDVDGAQLRQRHHLLKVPLPLLLTE